MAYSIDTLPDEYRDTAAELLDQIGPAGDIEDEETAERVLQHLYERAAQIEFPMAMFMSRGARMQREVLRDDHRGSIGTYLEIVRLISEHEDVIEP